MSVELLGKSLSDLSIVTMIFRIILSMACYWSRKRKGESTCRYENIYVGKSGIMCCYDYWGIFIL